MKGNFFVKSSLLFVLSAAILSGCADFSLDFSEGGRFSDDFSYTVVRPDKGGSDITEDTAYPESKAIENFDGSPTNEYYPDDTENFIETPADADTDNTDEEYIISDPELTNENIFSTLFSENVENDITTINNYSDILYTESIYVPYSTESNNISIFSCTADVSKYTRNIVENMTKEEKAAQLILARCPSENAVSLMEKYNFGGYTLYAVDFAERDTASAKSFISDIKNSSDIVPFIAVDEEGGNVVRVSKYPAYRNTPFDSMLNIYKNDGMEGIVSDSKEKAVLLDSLGINLNLAPVADIAESGDYIYSRTAGCSASDTGRIVRQIIDTSGEYNIMSCIKHFPGYGGNADTHTGISHDSRSLDSFRSNDFIPFKAGLESPYSPAVLINHNIVECMDGTSPASLSPEVHRILREELGFNGVIITDDLGMDGIKAYTGSLSPYAAGIMAGNDMLCVSDPVTAYNDIIDALNNGTISTEILDEHVRRIIQMKLDGKIIN